MEKLSDDYDIYIVKRNDGKTVRLTCLNDVLGFAIAKEKGFKEIELTNYPLEDVANPIWQKNCIIWFSPFNVRFIETTRDDEAAERSYQLAVKTIDSILDVTPENMQEGDTLMKMEGKENVYQVIDGQMRKTNKWLN